MKSKILFVLTVMSFLKPISGMADQMTSYKGSPSVKCEQWKEKMLGQLASKQNKEASATTEDVKAKPAN